jgi:hypothetical protein
MNEMADKTVNGLLVEFDNTLDLMAAAEKVRDAGYRDWDVHSPIPIHGMDDAMGIRPTILPWLVLGAGMTGLSVALLMQWWMNAVNYPIPISGKPLFSLPANIPVTFELMVLFSAVTAVVSLIALNGFPRLHHPLFTSARFRRVTTDRFFIYIEAADPKFSTQKTREFLSSLGGLAVEVIED